MTKEKIFPFYFTYTYILHGRNKHAFLNAILYDFTLAINIFTKTHLIT